MNFQLSGRVAAISAASAGLGYATARTLAREGCKIGICARTEEKLYAAATAIKKETGADVFAAVVDVADHKQVRSFIQHVAQHYGQLDIVVANAGGPPSGPFASITEEQWEQALQQNLLSTMRMFHEALPYVQKSDQGRLIAITSITAKEPLVNMVLSNATRAAVHGIIKTLSREIANRGVTVNAVCPGITKTGRITELARQTVEREHISLEEAYEKWSNDIPLKRLGDPMEFAAAIAFLCSKQASFISGIALSVDGGALVGLP